MTPPKSNTASNTMVSGGELIFQPIQTRSHIWQPISCESPRVFSRLQFPFGPGMYFQVGSLSNRVRVMTRHRNSRLDLGFRPIPYNNPKPTPTLKQFRGGIEEGRLPRGLTCGTYPVLPQTPTDK